MRGWHKDPLIRRENVEGQGGRHGTAACARQAAFLSDRSVLVCIKALSLVEKEELLLHPSTA